MRPNFLHQSNEHVAQIGVQRLYGIDRCAQHREPLGQFTGIERTAEKRFQPTT
jgi:hypothetical protein